MPKIWRATLLLALLCAGTSALALAADATDPAADAKAAALALAQEFLAVGRTEFAAGNPAKAAEALDRAVEKDPSLQEAWFLLGKSHLAAGRNREAVTAFREGLNKTLAQADQPADKWKTDINKELARISPQMAQWDALRNDYAAKYRQIGVDAAAAPSSVSALEVVCLLVPDDAEAQKQHAALIAKQLRPLPPAPAKPDSDAARLLSSKAATLLKSGQAEEALRLQQQAVLVSQDAQTITVLAECFSAQKKAPEALALAALAADSPDLANESLAQALQPRIESLFKQHDPNYQKLLTLNTQCLAAATALATRAASAKDYYTAESALQLAQELHAPPATLAKLRDKVTGRVCLPASFLNFTKSTVCKWGPTTATPTISGLTMELRGTQTEKEPFGLGLMWTDRRLGWGRSIRMHWRIEFRPASERGADGDQASIYCPLPTGPTVRYALRDLNFALGQSPGYDMFYRTDPALLQAVFRDDGVYDITFEKDGPVTSCQVNGREVTRLKLTRAGLSYLSAQPFHTLLTVIARNGETVRMRATLLELAVTPDCVPGSK